MSTSATPSLEEFQGPYNASETMSRSHHHEGDPSNHCTEKEESLETDFQAIVALTDKSLRKYLERAGFKTNAIYVWDEFSPDKTIRLEVLELSLLTPKFLAYLQSQILASNYRWRILLMMSTLERGILVYPNVIRLGFRFESLGIERGLKLIVDEETENEKLKAIRLTKEISDIRPLVKEVFCGMPAESASILRVYSREQEKAVSLWVISKGDWAGVSARDLEVEVEEKYWILPDGTFGMAWELDESAAGVLARWKANLPIDSSIIITGVGLVDNLELKLPATTAME